MVFSSLKCPWKQGSELGSLAVLLFSYITILIFFKLHSFVDVLSQVHALLIGVIASQVECKV